MKIVIDIPKDIYEEWKLDGKYRTHSYAQQLILNGTPLPKGHGDLISKEQAIELMEFYQLNPQHFDFVNLIDEIKDEKPIIEGSDKEV